MFPDDLYQRLFTLIANHEIDAWQRCNGLWVEFRITTCHDQQSRRVTAPRLADQLARTAVAQVRDCAGVDDIDIRELVKISLRESGGIHLFAYGFAIGLVDFAAQRCNGKCCFWQRVIVHSFCPVQESAKI